MDQEISASTIFKVVEILIIGSLLVLLPGGKVGFVDSSSKVEATNTSISPLVEQKKIENTP